MICQMVYLYRRKKPQNFIQENKSNCAQTTVLKSFVPDSLAVDSTGNISVVSSTGGASEVSACGTKKCGTQQPLTSY